QFLQLFCLSPAPCGKRNLFSSHSISDRGLPVLLLLLHLFVFNFPALLFLSQVFWELFLQFLLLLLHLFGFILPALLFLSQVFCELFLQFLLLLLHLIGFLLPVFVPGLLHLEVLLQRVAYRLQSVKSGLPALFLLGQVLCEPVLQSGAFC
ncbi:hypothetical protein FQN60_015431, partial [Etheostoma spectabile]